MSANEFYEWLRYSQLEPFGAVRADWRTAYLLASLANMLRSSTDAPLTALDYAPPSVVGWSEAIDALRASVMSNGTGTEPTIPKHPNIVIFEEMMRIRTANVNDS